VAHSDVAEPVDYVQIFTAGNVKRFVFLPERDYVTFESLLSQIRLSVVCRLSVRNRCALLRKISRTKGTNVWHNGK